MLGKVWADYIYPSDMAVEHAAGWGPGQRLASFVTDASEYSVPGSDRTVELRPGTYLVFVPRDICCPHWDPNSMEEEEKTPESPIKKMKARWKAERKDVIWTYILEKECLEQEDCRCRELTDYLSRDYGTRNKAGTDLAGLATQEGTGLRTN